MTTKNSTGKGGSRRGAKPVIEHDPLSMEEGTPDSAATEPEEASAAPKKKAAAKTPAVAAFDLGESLTIAEVMDMHQRLLELLRQGGAVSLNGSDTESIDGAGLQLLAAFARDAGKQGIEIGWKAASDPVRKAAGQVGLQGLLGLDKVG